METTPFHTASSGFTQLTFNVNDCVKSKSGLELNISGAPLPPKLKLSKCSRVPAGGVQPHNFSRPEFSIVALFNLTLFNM